MNTAGVSLVLVPTRNAAAPERVFAAFTEDMGAWWRPMPLFLFTDGRAGVLSFVPGPDGRLVETKLEGSESVIGVVRRWEPPSRLSPTWREQRFEHTLFRRRFAECFHAFLAEPRFITER